MMASSDEQQVSSLTPAVCVTDWTLCALCQKNTRERLQCPANNSNKTALGASYKTLAQHLLKFEELGSKMPMSVNMARLDEGGGVENTFLKRSAVFHSSCRLKFNKTELKRRAASVDSKSEKIATAAESVDKKKFPVPLLQSCSEDILVNMILSLNPYVSCVLKKHHWLNFEMHPHSNSMPSYAIVQLFYKIIICKQS